MTQLLFLLAVSGLVLAIMAMRRLGDLHGVEDTLERLAREGRYLREKVRELEAKLGRAAGAGDEAETPSEAAETEADGPDVAPTKLSAAELVSALGEAQPTDAQAEPDEAPQRPEPEFDGAPQQDEAAPESGDASPAEPTPVAATWSETSTASTRVAARKAAAKPERTGLDLERMLGVRGAAVLGGLVMALAAILFFKHAFQQGWISPTSRLISGAVWGLVLIAAGGFARKRRYSWVPGALEGAGLVALYATIWATNYHYGFIGPTLAFLLMGLVTALGCVLSLRGNSLVTAQVGLVGGFATPLLLSSTSVQPFGLFGYLLLLDVALLFIGRRRGWPSIGLLAVLGTAVFEFLWFLMPEVLGRGGLGWSGGTHEGFGVVLLLAFGLVFLTARTSAGQADEADATDATAEAGEADPTAAASDRAVRKRKRGQWQLVELGGLGTSGAFAVYLAVEGELSADLWPTALMAVILSAGALFLALRRNQPAPAMVAPLFGLTIAGAWALDRQLASASEAWQLVGSVLALAGLGCLPLILCDSETRRTFLVGVRSCLVAASVLLLLLAIQGTGVVLSTGALVSPGAGLLWPLYAGLVGVGALLVATEARTPAAASGSDRARVTQTLPLPDLAFCGGLLVGLGLLLRVAVCGVAGATWGVGPWSLVGLVALPVALGLALAKRALAPELFAGLGVGGLLLLATSELLHPGSFADLAAPDGRLEYPFAGASEALGAYASRGLLPAFGLVLVVFTAAALSGVLRVRRVAAQAPRADAPRLLRHVAAWLVALAAPAFVLQAWHWHQWLPYSGGGSSTYWGGAALGAVPISQTTVFALLFFTGLFVLLWPTLHARLVAILAAAGEAEPRARTAAPAWTWRLLAPTAYFWSLLLIPSFEEATGLEFEREGMLLAATSLGLLLLVALRLGGGLARAEDGEPVATTLGGWSEVPAGEHLRTALNWFGAVSVFLVGIVLGELLPDWEALTTIALFALGLGALARLTGRASALRFAQTIAALAGISLIGMAFSRGEYAFSAWPVWNWLTYTNLGLAAVVAILLVIGRPLRREPSGFARGLDVLSAGLVLALIFVWLNLEISNHYDGIESAAGRGRVHNPGIELTGLPARDLAMSVVWGLYAIALLLIGSRRAIGALRWCSLGLILAAITKVFLFDLSHLEGLYRVGSLVGLALSLIVVSLLYQRFVFARPLADGEGPEPDEDGPPLDGD